MGVYNILNASLPCPRCGAKVETEINCYFGDCSNMVALKVGDSYPWRPRKQTQNGGRPDNGCVDGEGYMVCPSCQRDSFLLVVVREDVIVGIEPDLSMRSYIPDRLWTFKTRELSANHYLCEATRFDERSISRDGGEDAIGETIREAYWEEVALEKQGYDALYEITISFLWKWRASRDARNPSVWTVAGLDEKCVRYNAETLSLRVERSASVCTWQGQIAELAKPNCGYFHELVPL